MNLTYREIGEQYRSMAQSKEYLDGEIQNISSNVNTWNASSLVVLGCGSSYSLAKSFARMVNMHTGFPANALPAGDVMLHAPRYVKCFENALVLAVSRSGSTSEMLIALEEMKHLGCRFHTISLSCCQNSKLSALADLSLELPWAFDNSVCQTRTVSCLYFSVSYILAKLTHYDALLADLDDLILHGGDTLKAIDALTQEYAKKDWSSAVILGDGELCGLAEEGALAFKEICQLPSNYYHLLDARHGPMVLFERQTLIIAALGPGNHYELEFLQDMAKKTPHIIVLSDRPAELEGVTAVGCREGMSQTAKGLLLILICQLLSYHKALIRGTDPDAPTGLDAWINL